MTSTAFLPESSPGRASPAARRPANRGRADSLLALLGAMLLGFLVAGCASPHAALKSKGAPVLPPSPTLQEVGVSDSTLSPPTQSDSRPGGPVSLFAARNEWTSFALRIGDLPAGPAGQALTLRLRPLTRRGAAGAGASTIPASSFETYQVLPMPVDVNRAGYVRHTGQSCCSAEGTLPRALLPVGPGEGAVPFSALRDPASPTNSSAHPAPGGAVHVWVDLHVPAGAPAGEYDAACDVFSPARPNQPLVSLPLRLTVYDFRLPDERHLQMVSRVPWKSLERYYPRDFETVTPRLITREGAKYAGTLKTLDALVEIAQHNRLAVFFPKLQPTVKWPALVNNPAPNVDWRDFDTVVAPWLKGDRFPDKVPLGYWPLPEPDFLRNYDVRSRLRYWSLATTHFDQSDWLDKTAVVLEKETPGPVTTGDSLELSAEAAGLLDSHGRLRVTVPMEDEQVQLVVPNVAATEQMVKPEQTGRLLAAAPGLVFNPPEQPWPQERGAPNRPAHWLRTDLAGLVPYVGAGGDERDVRLWAWLAFQRQAHLVIWGSAFPSWREEDDPRQDPKRPADPNELIWFYPGAWFGADRPVPTIQLKWLRRAQEDYEYLWLAKERGEVTQAFQMARLLTKPVELARDQAPDATYNLMSGTTDPEAWVSAIHLLARAVLLHPAEPALPVAPAPSPALPAAEKAKQDELYIDTMMWQAPHERPLLIGRLAQWTLDSPNGAAGAAAPGHQPGAWLRLEAGLDIYNAADVTANDNWMKWTALPAGWEVKPQPVQVPKLETYHVHRASLEARVNTDKLKPGTAEPVGLEFLDAFKGPDKGTVPVKLVLPVAVSEKREGRFSFDGKLDDWTDQDLIQNGPMVRMLDRPGVQKQQWQYASTPTKIYTGWHEVNFYVAFAIEGLSTGEIHGGQNFVDYQARRAWGEDLCEVLIQPVYADNTAGPVLHIVCKPNGSDWVERKLNPKNNAIPWAPFQGTGIRYAASLPTGSPSGSKWTGELAVPWSILFDPKAGAPVLLRFNFAQHRHSTGESASWAGPVDFGRDDAFTGAIFLHLPDVPGMAEQGHGRPNPSPGPTVE